MAFVRTNASTISTDQTTVGVRAASRALAILKVLADPRQQDWPLEEIARTLDLPKSTTHRLLETLKSQRFVVPGTLPGSYRLGLEAAIVGSRAIEAQRPRNEVRDAIARAASEIGETIGLGILEGRHVLVVEKGVPSRPFSWNLGVGTTMPAHATAAGKVLLSGLRDSDVVACLGGGPGLVACGPKTIRTMQELLGQLAVIRDHGYAIDDEEFEEGLRCVAVPLRTVPGTVSHSLGITAPASRVTYERLRELAGFLTDLGTELTRYFGFERAAAAFSA